MHQRRPAVGRQPTAADAPRTVGAVKGEVRWFPPRTARPRSHDRGKRSDPAEQGLLGGLSAGVAREAADPACPTVRPTAFRMGLRRGSTDGSRRRELGLGDRRCSGRVCRSRNLLGSRHSEFRAEAPSRSEPAGIGRPSGRERPPIGKRLTGLQPYGASILVGQPARRAGSLDSQASPTFLHPDKVPPRSRSGVEVRVPVWSEVTDQTRGGAGESRPESSAIASLAAESARGAQRAADRPRTVF